MVNVQGDEPLIEPALIAATAAEIGPSVPMATAAHAIASAAELFDPNVVKVVLERSGRALYFSRAPIPWHRDGFAQARDRLPPGYAPLRHIGLYAYRNDFLQAYPALEPAPLERIEALEQLRVPVARLSDRGPRCRRGARRRRRYAEDLERVRRHFQV